MTDIKIKRLEIRMKGMLLEDARTSILDLPRNLAEQLAVREDMIKEKRRIHINKIESGTLTAGENSSPSDLRTRIASRIAKSIRAKIK